jgi:hypothetical protein
MHKCPDQFSFVTMQAAVARPQTTLSGIGQYPFRLFVAAFTIIRFAFIPGSLEIGLFRLILNSSMCLLS